MTPVPSPMDASPTEGGGVAVQRAWRGERLLAAGLCVWAVGVQANEGLAVAGALLAVLAMAPGALREGGWGRWARAWAPLLLFVAWGVLVTLSRGQLRSSGALARHLDWLLVPVAAAGYARLGPRSRGWLALLAAVALLLGCALAGLQHFGVWPGEAWMKEHLGWTRLGLSRVYEPVPGAPGRFMGGGLLFHRLKFAHVAALGALWALAVALRLRGRAQAAALGACALTLLSVLVFPYARAASAALGVSLGLVLLTERRHRRLALGFGGAFALALVAVLVLHGSFRERLLSAATGRGSGDRHELIAAGLSAVRSHPLVGTGLGHFRVGEWARPEAPVSVREHRGKAHNLFLSTAAEMGVPGLALLLVLLGWLLRRTAAHLATRGAAGLASVAFLLLLGLVHDPLFHAEVSLAFALCFGIALAPQAAQAREAPAPASSARP